MDKIYLYVKQHSVTKLKYFGKTKRDPYTYHGSGSRWTNHINKHGREYIETLEVWEFQNQEQCTEFALTYSEDNNVTTSPEWANIITEDGKRGGGVPGRRSDLYGKTYEEIMGPERAAKLKALKCLSRGYKHTTETKEKISKSLRGHKCYWVTDGRINRRVKSLELIPEGFRNGRICEIKLKGH